MTCSQDEPTILPLPPGEATVSQGCLSSSHMPSKRAQVSAMSAEPSAAPASPEMEVPTEVPSPTSPALDPAVATVPTVVPFKALQAHHRGITFVSHRQLCWILRLLRCPSRRFWKS